MYVYKIKKNSNFVIVYVIDYIKYKYYSENLKGWFMAQKGSKDIIKIVHPTSVVQL